MRNNNILTAGIIGGLGPETTSKFYLEIIELSLRKSKYSRPPLVISNVPIPYNIEKDLILSDRGTERYVPFLVDEARRLEKAGVDFIAMPCNSLHIFWQEIQTSVNIPILNIVKETTNYLRTNKLNNIGLISTSTTAKNKLYENIFTQEGIDFQSPSKDQQYEIDRIIFKLVSGNYDDNDRTIFVSIIQDLHKKGSSHIALACTDLQLLMPKDFSIRVFDTMKVLAEATVDNIFKDCSDC